jgi:hypothetical protein
MGKPDDRPVYLVRLRPKRGVDGGRAIRGVRYFLKRALRTYGLVAIDAREESSAQQADRPDRNSDPAEGER